MRAGAACHGGDPVQHPGADVMAQHGYLEEVWDEGSEDLDQVELWPVVDILDDGRVVARRMARGFTYGT